MARHSDYGERWLERTSRLTAGAVCGLALSLAMAPGTAIAAATFAGIGALSGDDESRALVLSGDGEVVVGTSGAGATVTRFTASGASAIQVIPWTPVAASFDGSVVVGNASGSGFVALRWELGVGFSAIDPNVAGFFADSGAVVAISGDGARVAGFAVDSAADYRWGFVAEGGSTVNEAAYFDPLLCGGANPAGDRIDLMSSDGNGFVGAYYCDGFGLTETPVSWRSDGTQLQSPLPLTTAASADGLLLVGSDGGQAAFEVGGVVTSIGALPGGSSESVALDVSAAGDVIVGRATTPAGDRAFVWDAVNGMRTVESLVDPALLTGWTLLEAVAVSEDGLVIAGNGTNAMGMDEGWKVELSAAPGVPALGSGGVVLLSAALLHVGVWARSACRGRPSSRNRSTRATGFVRGL